MLFPPRPSVYKYKIRNLRDVHFYDEFDKTLNIVT